MPDLETAVVYDTVNLGMVERHRELNAEQGFAEVMLAVPSAPKGSRQLQLLAPLTAESTIARFLDRSGPGLQQLAYQVADVEQVAGILREKGLRLIYDSARRGTNDTLINFVHPKDAGGFLIDLVQYRVQY